MAQFPTAEADIVALANAMVAGYTAHPADFPSMDPLTDLIALQAAISDYGTAKTAQVDALAIARVATEAKNLMLASLELKMRDELKKSEVDVGVGSEKLEYIGWGPRVQPSPSDPPGQPRNLDPVVQGSGTVFLDWKQPASGSGGAVRTYVIERRQQPEGGGEFGDWEQAGIALKTETTVTDQPRGPQLEYRVNAVNSGGTSMPSNTAAVVL